jgi:serine/threonine-protein kinase
MTGMLYLPVVSIPSSFNPAEEILIPAGSFQMGCDSSNSAETCSSNEQPLHTVTLSAYTIDKYEVTNARYKACVDAGGCTAPQSVDSWTRSPYYGTSTYADYPVINVTWHQASAFCAWSGKRLPTEAEWEKAARGSSDTRKYPWGNSALDCTKLNYNWCVGDTSRVGSYPSGASPYGVMDMAGNVDEWVQDWYSSDYYSVSPSENPPGPATGTWRVLRGGSWYYYVNFVRSAARDLNIPDIWYVGSGFRCVRSQ